jgi:beta-N-acetylhexosaminidase
MRTALIVGVAGTELSRDEAQFLKDARPAGFILFGRNLKDHAQIRALIADVYAAVGGDDLLVLIDQEGGRVQRLRPPLGRTLPPGAVYGQLYARDRDAGIAAAYEVARLMAADLIDLGINTDCAPVLDLPVPGAHDIIGDRAYGVIVEQVVALGEAVADGFIAGGVVPVIKHIPGHGRAMADSHLSLPVVGESRAELMATDFAPFKALSRMPAAMTAHVVFRAIDPNAPASTSPIVTREIIRGAIGFDGLLMSDDLTMKALSGPMRQRADAVIAAGSDLALHCNGDIKEMIEAAAGAGALKGRSQERFDAAVKITKASKPFDSAMAEAHLAKVLAFAAGAAESV